MCHMCVFCTLSNLLLFFLFNALNISSVHWTKHYWQPIKATGAGPSKWRIIHSISVMLESEAWSDRCTSLLHKVQFTKHITQ